MIRFLSRSVFVPRRRRRRRRNPGPLSFISHKIHGIHRARIVNSRVSAFAADANERRSATKEPSGFQGECSLLLNPLRRSSTSGESALLREVLRAITHPLGWLARAQRLALCGLCVSACEGGGACKGNSWAIVFPSAFKAMLPHSASDLKVNGHSR